MSNEEIRDAINAFESNEDDENEFIRKLRKDLPDDIVANDSDDDYDDDDDADGELKPSHDQGMTRTHKRTHTKKKTMAAKTWTRTHAQALGGCKGFHTHSLSMSVNATHTGSLPPAF